MGIKSHKREVYGDRKGKILEERMTIFSHEGCLMFGYGKLSGIIGAPFIMEFLSLWGMEGV